MAVGRIPLAKGELKEFRKVSYRKDKAVVVVRLIAKLLLITPKGKKKDPWFLVSSLPRGGEAIVHIYEKRFTIEEDFRIMKFNFGWGDSRIKRLEHYRQFLLLVVLAMMLCLFVGLAAERKPSLAKDVVRKRKGKFDTCITIIGHRLLQVPMSNLDLIHKIDKIPYPL
jgi:transposase